MSKRIFENGTDGPWTEVLRFEDAETACEATRRVLRHVAAYDTVYTNRLHMCISACLTEVKHAYCYPGSTWKVESTFNYSIDGTFPAARLVSQTSGKVKRASKADDKSDEAAAAAATADII